jgi:hypothetical protein
MEMDNRFSEKYGNDPNINSVSTSFLSKKTPEFKIPCSPLPIESTTSPTLSLGRIVLSTILVANFLRFGKFKIAMRIRTVEHADELKSARR